MREALLFLCATCTLPRGEADFSPPSPPSPPAHVPPSDFEYIPQYSPPETLGKAYGHDKKCTYEDHPWSDCDPFHLTRWRNRRLTVGGSECQQWKNETKHCTQDELPPGLRWLVSEHKKCVGQLEHLKSAIADMHRWIDLIHERGEAMYKAFAELRSHLEDIQSRIEQLHRANHDDRETTDRLKKELEDWKDKCRRVNVELEDVTARYEKMEKEHSKMMYHFGRCQRETSGCKRVSNGLGERLDTLEAEARELQGRLMDAERYREMVSRANVRIRQLLAEIERLGLEIGESKKALIKCRVEVVNAKSYKPPGFNKDTHVNLDMQMWITHNQTREKTKYTPLIHYNESPAHRPHYDTPYKQAPIQQPQVYTSSRPPSTYTTTSTTSTPTTTTTTTTTTSTLYKTAAMYRKLPPPISKPAYHPAQSLSLSQPVKY